MAAIKPTLPELKARISADIERHTGEKATGRGDLYFGIAMAHAGACYGLHGHLDYNRDQLFDQSADDEHLLKRAAEMGIYQIAPIAASGTATFPGTEGQVLLAGTLFVKDGLSFRTTSDATVTGGVAQLNLLATQAGAAGNLAAGTTLNIFKTQAGFDTQAQVVELAGGSEAEAVSRVRERLQARRQNPPMGGNEADYIAWAKAAHPDVTRAWCYRNEMGLGTVVVRFTTDNLASPIPSAPLIQAVTDYINSQRPAGMAGFTVGVLVAQPVDVTFTALSPNTQAVQGAVTAELNDFIQRSATPGGELRISQLNEAISVASGEQDHQISQTADIQSLGPNHLLVPGTYTFPA